MSARAGFVWESPQYFNRYIEECGIACDLVTPHMLAAPFFRGAYHCLIIPTGFGNPVYSRLLPALRASSARIRRFVESGGNLLVFGAAADKPDAYDWLPFQAIYRHGYRPRAILCPPSSEGEMLVVDYDSSHIECDGIFTSHTGECIGRSETDDVILKKTIGKGIVIITTVHEFPSKKFLHRFCSGGLETVF